MGCSSKGGGFRPFPKTSPSSHALSLLPHSGFILSVSSRFLARRASSWASRRVELRASALTCLAKAWRSSSWGEECRCRWACCTGLGVEGELDRGGQGAGSHGAHIPPPGIPSCLEAEADPASHNALGTLTLCPSPGALAYVSARTKSHLRPCPPKPMNCPVFDVYVPMMW